MSATVQAVQIFADYPSVKLTEAHNRLGQIVDECQREPIILRKHDRNRAAIVSMDFLEEALDALHGHRRVTRTETLTDDQKADIRAALPTNDEISTGRWAD